MIKRLVEQAYFNVLADHNNRRIQVEVKGLGTVLIHRDQEGVNIQVFDNVDTDNPLANLNTPEYAFYDRYHYKLDKLIKSFDSSAIVDIEFSHRAYKNEYSLIKATKLFFINNPIFVGELQPLKGEVKGFSSQVKDLTEPYIEISKVDMQSLMAGEADFYQTTGGQVVTFGDANGGPALMPLQEIPAKKILENQ